MRESNLTSLLLTAATAVLPYPAPPVRVRELEKLNALQRFSPAAQMMMPAREREHGCCLGLVPWQLAAVSVSPCSEIWMEQG